MKVVIPGGSGQVGTILARALHGAGHDSGRPQSSPGGAAMACSDVGRRQPRPLGGRDRRGRRRHQPGGAQCQLPIQRLPTGKRSCSRASCPRSWWVRPSPRHPGRPGCGYRRAPPPSMRTGSTPRTMSTRGFSAVVNRTHRARGDSALTSRMPGSGPSMMRPPPLTRERLRCDRR